MNNGKKEGGDGVGRFQCLHMYMSLALHILTHFSEIFQHVRICVRMKTNKDYIRQTLYNN